MAAVLERAVAPLEVVEALQGIYRLHNPPKISSAEAILRGFWPRSVAALVAELHRRYPAAVGSPEFRNFEAAVARCVDVPGRDLPEREALAVAQERCLHGLQREVELQELRLRDEEARLREQQSQLERRAVAVADAERRTAAIAEKARSTLEAAEGAAVPLGDLKRRLAQAEDELRLADGREAKLRLSLAERGCPSPGAGDAGPLAPDGQLRLVSVAADTITSVCVQNMDALDAIAAQLGSVSAVEPGRAFVSALKAELAGGRSRLGAAAGQLAEAVISAAKLRTVSESSSTARAREVSEQLTRVRAELEAASQRSSTLQEERDCLFRELAAAREQKSGTDRQLAAATADAAAVRRKMLELEDRVAGCSALEDEVRQLRGRLQSFSSRDAAYRTLEDEAAGLRRAAAHANAVVDAAERRAAEAEEKLRTETELATQRLSASAAAAPPPEITVLVQRLEAALGEKAKAEAAAESARRDLQRTRTEAAGALSRSRDAEGRASSADAMCVSVQERAEEAEAALAAAKEEIAALSDRAQLAESLREQSEDAQLAATARCRMQIQRLEEELAAAKAGRPADLADELGAMQTRLEAAQLRLQLAERSADSVPFVELDRDCAVRAAAISHDEVERRRGLEREAAAWLHRPPSVQHPAAAGGGERVQRPVTADSSALLRASEAEVLRLRRDQAALQGHADAARADADTWRRQAEALRREADDLRGKASKDTQVSPDVYRRLRETEQEYVKCQSEATALRRRLGEVEARNQALEEVRLQRQQQKGTAESDAAAQLDAARLDLAETRARLVHAEGDRERLQRDADDRRRQLLDAEHKAGLLLETERSLRQRVSELEAGRGQLLESERCAQRSLEDANEARERLQREQAALRRQFDELAADKEAVLRRLDEAQSAAARQERESAAELERLQRQVAEGEESHRRSQGESEDRARQLEAVAERRVDMLRERLAEAENARDAFQNEALSAGVALQDAERRVACSFEDKLRQAEAEADRLLGQVRPLQDRVSALEAERAAAAESALAQAEQLREGQQARDALERDLSAERASLQTLVSRMDDIDRARESAAEFQDSRAARLEAQVKSLVLDRARLEAELATSVAAADGLRAQELELRQQLAAAPGQPFEPPVPRPETPPPSPPPPPVDAAADLALRAGRTMAALALITGVATADLSLCAADGLASAAPVEATRALCQVRVHLEALLAAQRVAGMPPPVQLDTGLVSAGDEAARCIAAADRLCATLRDRIADVTAKAADAASGRAADKEEMKRLRKKAAEEASERADADRRLEQSCVELENLRRHSAAAARAAARREAALQQTARERGDRNTTPPRGPAPDKAPLKPTPPPPPPPPPPGSHLPLSPRPRSLPSPPRRPVIEQPLTPRPMSPQRVPFSVMAAPAAWALRAVQLAMDFGAARADLAFGACSSASQSAAGAVRQGLGAELVAAAQTQLQLQSLYDDACRRAAAAEDALATTTTTTAAATTAETRHQPDSCAEELKHCRAALAEERKRRVGAEEAAMRTRLDSDKLRAELAKRADEVTRVREDVHKADRERASARGAFQRDVSAAAAEVATARADADSVRAEHRSLLGQYETLKLHAEHSAAEERRAAGEAAAARSESDALRREVAALRAEQAAFDDPGRLRELHRKEMERATSLLQDARATHAEEAVRRRAAEVDGSRLREDVERLTAALDSERERPFPLPDETDLARLQESLQAEEARSAALSREVEEHARRRDRDADELAEVRRQLASRERELADLSDCHSTLADESEGLKAAAKAGALQREDLEAKLLREAHLSELADEEKEEALAEARRSLAAAEAAVAARREETVSLAEALTRAGDAEAAELERARREAAAVLKQAETGVALHEAKQRLSTLESELRGAREQCRRQQELLEAVEARHSEREAELRREIDALHKEEKTPAEPPMPAEPVTSALTAGAERAADQASRVREETLRQELARARAAQQLCEKKALQLQAAAEAAAIAQAEELHAETLKRVQAEDECTACSAAAAEATAAFLAALSAASAGRPTFGSVPLTAVIERHR